MIKRYYSNYTGQQIDEAVKAIVENQIGLEDLSPELQAEIKSWITTGDSSVSETIEKLSTQFKTLETQVGSQKTETEGELKRIDDSILALKNLIGEREKTEERSVFEILSAHKNSIDNNEKTIDGIADRVTVVEQDLAVLKGDSTDSIKTIIDTQINAWANKTTDNGKIDTFKEISDYVNEHSLITQNVTKDIQELKEKDTAINEQIVALNQTLNNKVDKKQGYSLISDLLIEKLEKLDATGEENYIKSVSNEFVVTDGKLSINKIEQDKIEGLADIIAAAGALNGVQVNGKDVQISNKKVNINFNDSEFEYDGDKISLKKVSLSKLAGADGEELILNGGNA